MTDQTNPATSTAQNNPAPAEAPANPAPGTTPDQGAKPADQGANPAENKDGGDAGSILFQKPKDDAKPADDSCGGVRGKTDTGFVRQSV